MFAIVLLILALCSNAETWHEIPAGRITSAISLTSTSTILTSATGTISLVDPNTSDTIWHLPSLHKSQTLEHLRVEHLSSTSLILTVWSPCTLRIIRPDGTHPPSIVAQLPAKAYLRPNPHEPYIRLTLCEGAFIWYSLEALSIVEEHSIPNLPSSFEEYVPPSPSDEPDEDLSWTVGDIVLTSHSDGLFTAERNGSRLWHREEALGHALQAQFFTNPSMHKSLILLLTDLHVVFGLAVRDASIVWKASLPPDAPRLCKMLPARAEVAVVVCSDDADTSVIFIDVSTGELSSTRISAFAAEQAAHAACTETLCVRMRSPDGDLRTVPDNCDFCDGVWVHPSSNHSELVAYRGRNLVWRFAMPSLSEIVKVVLPRREHPAVSQVKPPPVRVTGNRELLFKYVDPDVILTISADVSRRTLHAALVDGRSGSVYSMVTHKEASGPVAAARGDNWFVYSFWNCKMLEQEVHVIDLYQYPTNSSWLLDSFRGIAAGILGPRISELLNLKHSDAANGQCALSPNDQCSAPPVEKRRYQGKPSILRTSMLLTKRVVGMETTQTELGITQPSILMTLESGQVAMVSKSVLDARRPYRPTADDLREFLIKYSPVISLSSLYREVKYVTKDIFLPDVRSVTVAPVNRRESSCQIIVLGREIFYTVVRPVGNFDSLPVDFRYWAVAFTISALVASFFYTNHLRRKQALFRSW